MYSLSASAQIWEFGGNIGGAGYIGDLNQTNLFQLSGINGGVFIRNNFDEYWSLGLHLNYGRIKSADANAKSPQQRQRNLSFQTPLTEMALTVHFNFLDYFSGGGFKQFTPFLQAGAGWVNFSPKTDYQGTTYKLGRYKTEGQSLAYQTFVPTFIYGGGVKYNLFSNWSIIAQIAYRTALTDYLDDVSGSYASINSFNLATDEGRIGYQLSDRSSPKIGQPGTQRGDFRKRDNYMFAGIGISYTFVSQKCF